MPHGFQAVLVSSQADGSALSNSTTATSILPAQAKYTLGASLLDVPGRQLIVRAAGRISNIVTTPGNLTLEVRFGSVVVASTGTMALNTTAKTNVAWKLEWLLTARSVGGSTSATLMHQAVWTSESVVGSAANTALPIMGPASAPAVGTGFDSTAAQLVDLFATFSVANSGNAITCHQFQLIDCGP